MSRSATCTAKSRCAGVGSGAVERLPQRAGLDAAHRQPGEELPGTHRCSGIQENRVHPEGAPRPWGLRHQGDTGEPGQSGGIGLGDPRLAPRHSSSRSIWASPIAASTLVRR